MNKKFFAGVALLISLLAVSGLSYAAGAVARLSITGGSLTQCTGNVIEGAISVTAYDSTGATISSFNATESFVTSTGSTDSQSFTFTSGASTAFYMGTGVGTLSYVDITLSANGVTSPAIRIGCDGSVSISSGGTDVRLNFANGDLINVLYSSTDSAGKGGVAVYSVNSESKGVYEGSFGYALFSPYLGNPPSVNTFLGKVDQSSLYALTSGEFQIVIADPLESKSYTTIFSAFPISGVYFH